MEKNVERPSAITLVKEFLDDFLSLKKGVLYTIGQAFLKPWEVFQLYISAQSKLISSPLKLLLTISPLLALFAYITPSEEFMTNVAMDMERLGYTTSNADMVEGVTGELSEEKKQHIDSEVDETNRMLFNTMDEYPVAVFLVNIALLGLAVKTVFPKNITLFDAMLLSGYIIIPYTMLSTVLGYLLIWTYGFDTGFSLILGGLQLLALGLLLYYLYNVGRELFEFSISSSVIRMLGSFILMQLYSGFFGILLGATIKIVENFGAG
ncbi:hypothetical protein KFE96_10980 [Kordiimonas sp. SCSIO 12603]|uniref:hypothetical protein n=1 Tax=Kordiimonas sp. SCSIO 12603 TaxID=2829596 RepID=UPI0021050EA6|nr:hypothetical protein [Kordiimonas sp. SCSIO 12603]UTW57378.1 hypothetical protein KFE96_10980 [Kordiimonas sp. SCSIO 12603]